MNALNKLFPIIIVAVILLASLAFQADAVLVPGPLVSKPGNKHNLSALNTSTLVTYKAVNDPTGNPRGQEICIFCHTPHNANVEGGAPLWNRNFSTQTFQRYTGSSSFVIKNNATANYYGSTGQPDGSSKLCLSCHDGVSSLGAVKNGSAITMVSDVITGRASFNPAAAANKMRYGHHPVSFVYNDAVKTAINTARSSTAYSFPPTIPAVKLDGQGKMQCTTCHNAHQNQSDDDDCYGGTCAAASQKKAPFWVYHNSTNSASQDRDAVCNSCHAISQAVPNAPPTNWLQ